MQQQKPVIVVHGGAGAWSPQRRKPGLEGVKEAAQRGFEILKASGTALDAVEEAVTCMEDNEVFNAGLGSTLSIDRRIEMEASIMDGETLNAGAVGLLKDIRNPVRLARVVMEKTDHVFLVADGAEKLAQIAKMERRTPLTKLKLQYWREMKEKMKKGELKYLPRLNRLVKTYPNLFEPETVGAVALDKRNDVAAATSTGGFSLKLPGRIGDSPLIGCGTYADKEAGGCSATGIGEIAIRLVLAKNVCDRMHKGESAQEAVENSIQLVNRRIKNAVNSMGLVAVDMRGGIGAAHNSPNLCWAYMKARMHQPKAALKAEIVKETA